MEKLSQDKLWAIYETLSGPLKDAIFSPDTADAISSVAELNDIENKRTMAELVSNVLFGLLPLELLPDILQDELKIDKDLAKKISMELEHFIFNSVKTELDELYNTETHKPKPEETKNDDSYREPIS